MTYYCRANHPTFSRVKQQSFHCARGYSRSGIWTEHREDGPSLLHGVWHLSWGNSKNSWGMESPTGFFTPMLVSGLVWLQGWLQLELLTRAPKGHLLCGSGYSWLGGSKKGYFKAGRGGSQRRSIPREPSRSHSAFTDLASVVISAESCWLQASH